MSWLDLSAGEPVAEIRNARIPEAVLAADVPATDAADGLTRRTVRIAGGRIAAVETPRDGAPPPGQRPSVSRSDGRTVVDLAGGILLPAFTDVHTHVDKGHIWPRTPNPDGTFASALAATGADRQRSWTATDVRRRMDFSLRCAFAHGTRRLRTHIDSIPPQDRISWPVVAAAREAWAGRIDLQAVSLVGIDGLPAGGTLLDFAAHVKEHGGILGAVLYPTDGLEAGVERIFEAAMRLDMDLDFHVDENGDPASRCLDLVARTVLATGFPGGRVTCGHCCSLALQPAPVAAATIERVAEAGLSVVSLPLCNMYLQDRAAGATPRWRGVTLLNELAAAGVPACVASDNTRDPFYAYGDLDMLEVLRESVRILHLDHPAGPAVAAATTIPARIMGAEADSRVAPGAPADLVLVTARSFGELFARPQADRVVLRDGRESRAAPPDYRELDDLFAPARP